MSSPVEFEQSLAEIIAGRPGAAQVLRRYGLDYSGHGARSLGAACHSSRVDPDEVRRALIAARPERDDVHVWSHRPLPELVAHIKERYHERHRLDLPYLIDLAHRVERRWSAHPACPRGLEGLLVGLREDLEGHLDEEEQMVFPLIVQAAADGVVPESFASARCEHDHHLEALEAIRRLTGDLETPVRACRNWGLLYRGLVEFERDLLNHIHLENNVLFPRAAAEGRIAPV